MTAVKTRILTVDGEAGFTKLLRMNLEKTGDFEVFEVNEPSHTIDVARRLRPDVILLDVVMPGTNGNDLALQIERDPVLGRTPIIFLTALFDNNETEINAAVRKDGHTYLGKPIDLVTLVSSIRAHLPMPHARPA